MNISFEMERRNIFFLRICSKQLIQMETQPKFPEMEFDVI